MLTFTPSTGSAKNMTYDENGNMTSITNSCGTTTYTWDVRNRLVGINGFKPDCSPLTASFKYDALGRRIEKTINGTTTQYVYDGLDIIQEIQGSAKTNYIRTLNIDEPLVTVISHYRLDFWKQFGPSHELKDNTFARVPSLPAMAPVPTPTDADADELAVWDLTTLDAGPLPSPYVSPPDPKIYRGQSCTYSVQLFATDTTVVNEITTHYRYYEVPVKIVNDL